MDRATINSIGDLLASLRALDECDLIVGIGAHGPSYDSRVGHMSVTLRRGKDEATSGAVKLDDALHLARAKLTAQAAAREKAKAKEAADAA